ncbi:hypothetical protein SLS62_009332 [Diatrype stigma]|uniref:Dienelactone hydrolase domain-containing protein n=1 Tax=Diatrype stigma TaxID=117547 RepID=A0AAN9UGN2_9PEZI
MDDITGPKTATRAILYMYDIFGFRSQSLQGADILAHSSPKPCLVVMVDWFQGAAAQEAWFASGRDEDRRLARHFVDTTASPARVLPRVLDFLAKAKSTYFPGVQRWGAVGFCWGAKLVSLVVAAGGEDASPLLAAAAQSSPARLDPEEAKRITVPMAVLASAGEDADVVRRYGDSLQGEKYVETFGGQVHGWMSARGELEKAEVRSEYERGYKILIDFFDKYL